MSEKFYGYSSGELMIATDLYETIATDEQLQNLRFITEHFETPRHNFAVQPLLKISGTSFSKNKQRYIFEHWPTTEKSKLTRMSGSGYEALEFEQKELAYGTPALTSLHWLPGLGVQSKIYLDDELNGLPLSLVSLHEASGFPGQLDERSVQLATAVSDIVIDRASVILAEFREAIENPPQSNWYKIGKALGGTVLSGFFGSSRHSR